MTRTIALSVVSHTNAGKTTLVRTLLGRDVGEVRDEPHVTQSADAYLMVETAQGDSLTLWDTPGFGDSARLARRLSQSDNPLGWFMSEVWDRYRDRAFWSSQQAVRNVRDRADVVLYLVNASEDPADAGYVLPEMRVLDWVGKPVIVLLNQLGKPRTAELEAREIERWRSHLAGAHCVRAVLAFDAFARCWVQEVVLLAALESALATELREAFARIRRELLRLRRAVFESSMRVLAERVAGAASDREPVANAGWSARLRELGSALGIGRDGDDSPRGVAMSRLAERLDASVGASTDRVIELHGLGGRARGEILARLAEHYSLNERLSEGKAAALGGVLAGALTGLKADLA
ncbi:MAG: GTPase domain-containing protein, partial [Burkholderiaceae bacterium]|nr:GTPase domain-containing protein [Burkholderiaceae bacterium]